jgi:hypothetical protein
VRPAATGSVSSNTVTVQWEWPAPDAPVFRITHLAPRIDHQPALGLSFRHCPATRDVPESERSSRHLRAHSQRAMMMDVDQAAKAMRDEEMQAEIETSSKASISRPTAACRSTASGVRHLVFPRWVVWGRPARGGVAPLSYIVYAVARTTARRMSMDDKDRCDLLPKLAGLRMSRVTSRREHEWKVTVAFWASARSTSGERRMSSKRGERQPSTTRRST